MPFRGKPLLEHQVSAIRKVGIREIGVVTGYRREMLANRGLYEFHNSNWEKTQMVSSLACAEAWLEAGPCLISYSDIFYEASAISNLVKSTEGIAVTYAVDWLSLWQRRFKNPLEDAETFRLNQDQTIAEIGRKAKSIAEIEGQYMGLLKIMPEGWKEIQKIIKQISRDEVARLQMTGLLQTIIERKNIPIHAVPFRGAWGEVDSEKDLHLYEKSEKLN